MKKILLLALVCLAMLLPSVSATDMSTFTRGLTVESVTGFVGTYKGGCAAFTWDGTSDADFNTFILQISSTQARLTRDVNLQAQEYSVCTLAPGESVTGTIYRIDGNAEGFWKNLAPDAGYTVAPGSVVQGGLYLMFGIVAGLGSIVIIIIFVVVVTFILSMLGFQLLRKGK